MMFNAKMLALLALLPYQGLAVPTAGGDEALVSVGDVIPISDFLGQEISTRDMDGDVSSGDDNSEILARGRPVWQKTKCDFNVANRYKAFRESITQGIKELKTWKGLVSVPAKDCRLVWGKGFGGIYVCNENSFELRLPGYLDVADGAQMLMDKCIWVADGITLNMLNGRQHAQGNWLVAVQ